MIFSTFCLSLIDSFGGFTASISPLLLVLMDYPMEAILSMDFGLYVWSHPRFRYLAMFFPMGIVAAEMKVSLKQDI